MEPSAPNSQEGEFGRWGRVPAPWGGDLQPGEPQSHQVQLSPAKAAIPNSSQVGRGGLQGWDVTPHPSVPLSSRATCPDPAREPEKAQKKHRNGPKGRVVPSVGQKRA